MRKRFLLIAIALIAVVAVSAGLAWLTEADIRYYFNVDYVYQREGDQWVTFDAINEKQMNDTFITVECKNYGYFQGSFDLIVTFTNATFSTATAEPYQQINSTTAKFSYQLSASEVQSTNVHFKVNDDVKSFHISLFFQSNQMLIRSSEGNWLGINTLYYDYLEEENRFVAVMVQ